MQNGLDERHLIREVKIEEKIDKVYNSEENEYVDNQFEEREKWREGERKRDKNREREGGGGREKRGKEKEGIPSEGCLDVKERKVSEGMECVL